MAKQYQNNWDPRRRGKRGAEGILEHIIAENFPNLGEGNRHSSLGGKENPLPKLIKIGQHLDI